MRMMIEGDSILIDMPYNILLMDKIKQLDGKWDSKRELWRVDKSMYEDLVNINNKAEFHDLMTRQQRMSVMKDLYTRKGYSSKTSKNYLGHISRFLDYSEDHIELSDVNRYMVYLLDEKQCSHSYCNQAINAIKTYLRIFGVVNEEQLVKMDRPKKERKLPKVLAKSEMKDMLTMTKNVKHKTAFMIAYSCGLRVSEVANLKVTDIDSKRMVITIHQSKGRKDRIMVRVSKLSFSNSTTICST